MNRRHFLNTGTIAAGSFLFSLNTCSNLTQEKFFGKIMTVNGPIDPDEMGIFLPHEHVMSLFGADATEYPNYDKEKLFDTALPYLKFLKDLGCDGIADCTTVYFGRDPLLLKEISDLSGIKLLTNTGYYGAADDRYVPEHAQTESAEQLARRWIAEWEEGIDKTGIHPGFVKLGVDEGPLSEIDAKLVRAAAITHLETGLVLAIHTGNNPEAAKQQLNILEEEKVHPSAWIWVHANSVEDSNTLLQAAEKGAWIELDGVRSENIENHLEKIKLMKTNGFFNQVLLSHDGNSFRANNRPPKAYDSLFTDFIPALKKEGYSEDEIKLLTIKNPAKAFTIKVRSA